MFVKSFIKAFLEYIKKKRVERVIQRIDGMSRNGGHLLIGRVLDHWVLETLIYEWKSNFYNSSAIVSILTSLESEILSYLGDDVIMDNAYVSITNMRTKFLNKSWHWHHDGCGKRLKLYICFEGDGSQPTLLSPKSRLGPYRYYLKDALRIVLPAFGYKIKSQDIIAAVHKTGSINLFDTNSLHLGDYSQISERKCVVLEFISYKKFLKISNSCPVGRTHTGNEIKFSNNFIQKAESKILQNTCFHLGPSYFTD